MTIHDRVAAGSERLRAAGISQAEADLDARLLAERALGWDTARFFTSAIDPEPAGFADRYDQLIARRQRREPIAYITGRKEFWGLPFAVSPDVLIPRPETELIVETALELFPDVNSSIDIADVCTGSGCIAVALATERPKARIVATDLSPEALKVAEENAGTNLVGTRIRFRQADLLDGVESTFDLIVANPPYVRAPERAILQPEVRDHEPHMALFGGSDGLGIIRRLLPSAAARLRPSGVLVFEFGFGHDPDVEALVESTPGIELTEFKRDLQGIARAAVVRASDSR